MIRQETGSDLDAVRKVNTQAFESPAEASLVDALRERADPVISLVAVEADVVVGHIMFSPVMMPDRPDITLMGLAPMAVATDRQRSGIGSQLVEAGLAECRNLGVDAVVVLGHPEYYPRFGFVPSAQFGFRSEYDVPEDVFMALELRSGSLSGSTGQVRYHTAFNEL